MAEAVEKHPPYRHDKVEDGVVARHMELAGEHAPEAAVDVFGKHVVVFAHHERVERHDDGQRHEGRPALFAAQA